MKIGINVLPLLGPLTGIGRYTYEVCSRLLSSRKNFSYYFYRGYYSSTIPDPIIGKGNEAYPFLRLPLIKKVLKKIILKLSSIQKPNYVDIYFEPNNVPINLFKSKQIVTTLHDLSVFLYPHWHPKQRVEFFNAHKKNILKSDVIITDSNFMRNQIVDYFKIPEDRIEVVYLGWEPINNSTDIQLKELMESEIGHFSLKNFILFVGSIEPRKNLLGVIKAFLTLPEEIQKEYPLVIAGFEGWENKEIKEMLFNSENIFYYGHVSEPVLDFLYHRATLFVYPSFYEGFGLPPLEAMGRGCPVIVSNRASLPEVCGDAAYYVDPEDIDSIRNGLLTVIMDEGIRSSLRKKGLEQVRKFSWELCARRHMELFETLCS